MPPEAPLHRIPERRSTPNAGAGPSGPRPDHAPAAEPHHEADTGTARNGDLTAALDRLETQPAKSTRPYDRHAATSRENDARSPAPSPGETHHDEPDLET